MQQAQAMQASMNQQQQMMMKQISLLAQAPPQQVIVKEGRPDIIGGVLGIVGGIARIVSFL